MAQQPLLSVIIPIYKVEKYLDRCINSVVRQTYNNIEIILVDDGSPDNCPKMCDSWAEKDSRIKVIHKQNAGLGFARNSGLEIATGDYIAFIDSDDYVDLDMYETLISKSLKHNADIVYCGCHWGISENKFKDINDFPNPRVFEKRELLNLSLKYIDGVAKRPLMMSVWHSVYKRSVLAVEFYSERECNSEDLHFQLSAILQANQVAYIPQAFYYYCFNATSLSHSFRFEKVNKDKLLMSYILELYRQHGYDIDRILYRFYFGRMKSWVRNIIAHKDLSNTTKKGYLYQIVHDPHWDKFINVVKFSDFLNLDAKVFLLMIKFRCSSLLFWSSSIFYFVKTRRFVFVK